MNPLQISIKKYLTYQLISQSLFNKFYNVISPILSKYGINDCCNIEGCDIENLDNEIKEMHIGKSAVAFFQEDIEKFKTLFMDLLKSEKKSDEYLEEGLFVGQLEKLSVVNWNKVIAEFFVR